MSRFIEQIYVELLHDFNYFNQDCRFLPLIFHLLQEPNDFYKYSPLIYADDDDNDMEERSRKGKQIRSIVILQVEVLRSLISNRSSPKWILTLILRLAFFQIIWKRLKEIKGCKKKSAKTLETNCRRQSCLLMQSLVTFGKGAYH